MTELSEEYFRLLSQQLVFIGVFLGGISATILGTLIVADNDTKIFKAMIVAVSVAAVAFIVAVFGMNKVQLILAPDSPFTNSPDVLYYPRLVGGLAFYLGIFALITAVGISGWLKSKKIGIITTALGVIAVFLIFTLT